MLRFTDGGFYAQNATTLGYKYDAVSSALSPSYARATVGSGYAIQFNASAGILSKSFQGIITGANGTIVGFRYLSPASPVSGTVIAVLSSIASNTGLQPDLIPNNSVRIVHAANMAYQVISRNAAGTDTTLFTSANATLSSSVWEYLELRVYPTTGQISTPGSSPYLYVNATTQIAYLFGYSSIPSGGSTPSLTIKHYSFGDIIDATINPVSFTQLVGPDGNAVANAWKLTGTWSGTVTNADRWNLIFPDGTSSGDQFNLGKTNPPQTSARVTVQYNGSQVYDSGLTVDLAPPASGQPAQVPIDAFHVGYTKSDGTVRPASGAEWTDIYVADTSGANNNNFLGDTKIETLLPSGNGTTQQFQLVPRNALPDTNMSSLDTDATEWTTNTSGSVSRVTSGGPGSSTSGTGYGSFTSGTGVTGDILTTPYTAIPVVGGNTYLFAIDGATSIATNNPFAATIRWYDSSGTFISQSTGTTWAVSANTWHRVDTGVVTAPSNAAYAQCGLHISMASFPGGPYFWWDSAVLIQGADSNTSNAYVAPSTSHAVNVSETSADAAGYVRSSSSGSVEAYTFPTLASASGIVAGINFSALLKRETVGANTLVPMMRTRGIPTVVEVGTLINWNAGSATATMTNSTQAGDLVLVFTMWTPTWPVNQPTGLGGTWSTVFSDTANPSGALWACVNCAAGQTQFTMTQTSGTNTAVTVWMLIRGAATTSPIVASSTNNGTSADYVNAAISTTFPNQLVAMFWNSLVYNLWTGGTYTDSPGSFAIDTNANGRNAVHYEVAHRIATEVGAQSHSVHNNQNGGFGWRYYAVVIDPLISNIAAPSNPISTPVDTNWHAGVGILETNPSATSRPLTIAEVNAAEIGFAVP